MPLSADMQDTLARLAEALAPVAGHWLVGGSCGLLLQGVDLAKHPRDLDVYADRQTAAAIHRLLRARASDEPADDETPIYRSLLSHYAFGEVPVELVGGFVVRAHGSEYRTEVGDVLASFAPAVPAGNRSIHLTPLAHELVFNILRDRPDRYEAIAHVMKKESDAHAPALAALLERNRLSTEVKQRLSALLEFTPY